MPGSPCKLGGVMQMQKPVVFSLKRVSRPEKETETWIYVKEEKAAAPPLLLPRSVTRG